MQKTLLKIMHRKIVFVKVEPSVYFYYCPIYSNECLQLFRDTRSLHPLNCYILLFGNSAFTYSENITIVNAVHHYIKNSNRFTS